MTTVKKAPRVSVLMPVWNASAYLASALGSISAQTLDDLEILAIDDGSTDGSLAVLRDYAAVEPRLRIWARANHGVIATRNELLSRAHGELVAWMDADDIALPDRLALQVAALDQEHAVACVGTFTRRIDPAGHFLDIETFPLTHSEITDAQCDGGGMRFPTTMCRRRVAEAVGGFREPFRMGEDLDFLMRVGEAGHLANLPFVTYRYRQHLGSLCSLLGNSWPAYRDTIVELARERRRIGSDRLQRGEPVVLPIEATRRHGDFRSAVYSNWSAAAARNRDLPLALRYALSSIGVAPLDMVGWKSLRDVVALYRHGRRPSRTH